MRSFKYILLFIFFVGCGSSNNISTESKICPECNMPLSKDKQHTSYIDGSNYFDDIGCLVLWSESNRIELKSRKVYIFSIDTKKYIDAKIAHYTIDEKTPMNYGFSAYEKDKLGTIDFKEMRLRMLRGEHLANPKIRKKILGH